MSKLDDLIKKLCPDGVEWKELGEVLKKVKVKGILAKDLKDLADENGDVKLLSTGNFDGYTSDELAGDNLQTGEVITIPTGGTANIKYHNGKFVNSGNHIFSTNQNTKFIYYFLKNINEKIQNCFRGSSVQHPDMPQILNFQIPIPPLEVQAEIVRILDKFTALEAELTAELTARQKQYEYYRNSLLSFDSTSQEAGERERERVEWKELGEVCEIKTGKGVTKKDNIDGGKYPIVSGGIQVLGYMNEYNRNENTTTIARAGSAGYVNFITTKFWVNDKCFSIIPNSKYNDQIDPKYLYYYLKNDESNIVAMKSEGSVPTVNTQKVSKIKIPIPLPAGRQALEVQAEIVRILDKFDSLTHDISEGLPAEIDARHKQYEYYRNKLLSFEPAA